MSATSSPITQTFLERRRSRSNDSLIALGKLLDAARRRAGVDALALADASGCLVAGAGAARACEELAAYAPLLDSGQVEPPKKGLMSLGHAMAKAFDLDGVLAYLAWSGSPKREEIEGAASGCRRILRRPSYRFA